MAEPTLPRATSVRSDRQGSSGFLTLEESAQRVGHYRWAEMRFFEVLGGWVATVPELDVKLRLGTQCYHHAWHAELWCQRLPELREMDPERLTAPPNDELVAFMDALAAPQGPSLTIEKLVGAYRVLIPAKIAAYTHHLRSMSAITDAPTIRSLGFILQDELDDWRDGEMALQSLIQTGAELQRAIDHQAGLQSLLLTAGGIAGRGTFGSSHGDPHASEVVPRPGSGP